MTVLMDSKFMIGDRVIVAALCPLTNLVGRSGTVQSILPGSDIFDYEMMIEVRLDNLISKPDVPFYMRELIKLNEKEDYAQLRLV